MKRKVMFVRRDRNVFFAELQEPLPSAIYLTQRTFAESDVLDEPVEIDTRVVEYGAPVSRGAYVEYTERVKR